MQPQPVDDDDFDAATEAFRTKLTAKNLKSKERLQAAERALEEAKTELEAAKAAAEKIAAQFNSWSTNFEPPPTVQKGKGKGKKGSKAAAKTNGAPKVKVVAGKGGRVVINRPVKKPSSGNLTFPERLVSVMGNSIWGAAELGDALLKAGHAPKSNNVKSYIAATLSAATANVPGPDGVLKDSDGKPVKVHVFKSVDRGRYRAATEDDIQAEIKKLLGVTEVVISGTPSDVFEDRNIDVRQHH